MTNIAGPYTADVDGAVGPMTLALDSQGNLVNSTIGRGSRFTGPDTLTGTFVNSTGELSFTEQSRFPNPFPQSASYKGYVVLDQAPATTFRLVGVVDRTALSQGLGGFLFPDVVETAWIAFPGSPAITGGALLSRIPRSQGYGLSMNGQVRALGITLDANNNLVVNNSFLDNTPITGNVDPKTGKLSFNAVITQLPIAKMDSFFGYMLAVEGDYVLAGITDHIVVDTTTGTVTITNTETGWWAFPNPP